MLPPEPSVVISELRVTLLTDGAVEMVAPKLERPVSRLLLNVATTGVAVSSTEGVAPMKVALKYKFG